MAESRGVDFLPNNPIVASVSAFLNILFQEKVLINIESINFLNKINRVNKMKDNNGNEVYGCIYKITNIMNGKCYIGQTTWEYEKYIKDHFKNASRNKDGGNKYFYKAIRKYRKRNFKWEILGFCDSKEELNEAEIEAIWFFRSFGSDGEKIDSIYGYNLTKGGEGISGYRHTEESKNKMSERQIGKKRTEEHKKKVRLANIGKKYSDEVNAKKGLPGELNPFYGKHHTQESIDKANKTKEERGDFLPENNPFYGKEHTDETKEKIRQSLKGRKRPEEVIKKTSETLQKKHKEKLYNNYNINFIIDLYFEGYGIKKITKIYNSLYNTNLHRNICQRILNKFCPVLPKGHDRHPKTNQIKLDFIKENYNNKQDFYI